MPFHHRNGERSGSTPDQSAEAGTSGPLRDEILTTPRLTCTIRSLASLPWLYCRLPASKCHSKDFDAPRFVPVTRHVIPLLGFDDLAVGDEWESPRRTVTESDVVAFAGVSGDFNPIHVDHELARQRPFGRPVAHGLLGLAIASGLASHAPRSTPWRSWRSWTGSSSTPSPSATPSTWSRGSTPWSRARGRRGVVTWHRRIVNQEGKGVQEGTTQTLVRSRPRAGAPEPPPEG